jgi:hypothetical protein
MDTADNFRSIVLQRRKHFNWLRTLKHYLTLILPMLADDFCLVSSSAALGGSLAAMVS